MKSYLANTGNKGYLAESVNGRRRMAEGLAHQYDRSEDGQVLNSVGVSLRVQDVCIRITV